MKEIVYRVFDHKGNYQQSYSAQLESALDWAISCAKRTSGRVDKITTEEGKESTETVFNVSPE